MHIQPWHLTSEAAAAASDLLIAAGRILDYVCRSGDRSQVLLKSRCLGSVVSQDTRSLIALGCCKVCHSELALKIGYALVFAVQFELAQLVEDSSRVIRAGLSCRTFFCGNGVLQVCCRSSVFAAALLKGRLEREHLLHVSHLSGIGRDFSLIESGAKSLSLMLVIVVLSI